MRVVAVFHTQDTDVLITAIVAGLRMPEQSPPSGRDVSLSNSISTATIKLSNAAESIRGPETVGELVRELVGAGVGVGAVTGLRVAVTYVSIFRSGSATYDTRSLNVPSLREHVVVLLARS